MLFGDPAIWFGYAARMSSLVAESILPTTAREIFALCSGCRRGAYQSPSKVTLRVTQLWRGAIKGGFE